MRQFPVSGNWFTWLVFHKDDNHELIIRKKFFLAVNLIAILFISILAALAYFLQLENFTRYALILLSFNLVQTFLILILKKWPVWFIYFAFSLQMILIFYIINRLGGYANSAGLLMTCYFFLLTAQWMKDIKLLFLTGALFISGLLITGISFPYAHPDESMTGWENQLLFAVNFGWIGLALAAALYFSIVKSEKEAKNKTQQLQELDLLKSKLFVNIAHEFRTPLAIIRGNAGEISEEVKGETANRAVGIIRNSDRILFLVNQMLNLSRIEEGGVSLHYTQSDMVAFVRFMVNAFQGFADSKKIGLHFRSDCPQLIMDLEAEKLEEVLSNLLSNAIKYTPIGGEVYVTLRELKPSEAEGRQVEISLRDTGIGIPEDQLDKIFIRFYRVEDDRYPFQDGTGIGLTLVNEYLKLMQGSISVSSESDKGSEFIINLPVTHNAEMGEAIPQKESFGFTGDASLIETEEFRSGGCNPRLLIIEDNKELTAYLIRLLQKDYQILTAANGLRGIEMAVKHIPDIILSDVMMPGKDGYQVCKTLKNDFRTNHIPIALLTARADAHSRIIGIEHGADAYLAKPFDKKELTVCLNNLLVQREKVRLKYQPNYCETHPEEIVHGITGDFLGRVVQILEHNYARESFRIEELYNGLGISRVQLHRKLTALTGQSTSAFICSFRLQKAKKLLLETDKYIAEIAYEVGFSDPNYFSRAFIREFGVSPADFKRLIM